jgi:DNA-binding NtrC family response regulator
MNSTGHRPRILVCDDEAVARRAVVRALGKATYDFVEHDNGLGALETLSKRSHGVDLILLDLHMPGLDGMGFLARLDEFATPPPIVVVTADTSIRTAIDAVRSGAADYLCKPYAVDELRIVVEKSLETARLRWENRRLTAEVRRLGGSGELLGASESMRRVKDVIGKVAPTTASVLILGESGTGKELVARRIHLQSERAGKPFIAVNCAAIPDTLVESELFGHRRGAFTGADRDRPGKFQEADGGTLFLDEIGDMALSTQAKLLRTLQEGQVEPLGGGPTVTVDVRIVAATHHDLKRMTADGSFREDLLFRLRVIDLELPPLRDRNGDVLLLARHFLDAAGSGHLELSPGAEAALYSYSWPGNVRELANAMERAAIFCNDHTIRATDLPTDLRGEDGGATDPVALSPSVGEDFRTAKARVIDAFERRILTTALKTHSGNVSQAARALGLHRQNVQQKLRRLGISASSFKKGSYTVRP